MTFLALADRFANLESWTEAADPHQSMMVRRPWMLLSLATHEPLRGPQTLTAFASTSTNRQTC